MTVNELRDRLIEISQQGYGDAEINIFLDMKDVYSVTSCGLDVMGDVDILCSSD